MKTNSASSCRRSGGPRPRETGFTLIEMMISVGIGLGLLAGLIGVLASNSADSRSNDRSAEMLTSGRYAMGSIKQELRGAGFRGYTWAEPSPAAALTVVGCAEAGSTVAAFVGNIRQAVWGADNANPFGAAAAGPCIPPASYSPGNDVLVVRRVAALPAKTRVADTVYFHSSYGQGQVFQGATPPAFAGSPTPLDSFPLEVYVYYVSPYTISATENPRIPALFRVGLLPNGAMARELVASGIEHLQVQYGRLTTEPALQYLDTLVGAASATDPSDWDQVNSVRLWLVVRSATPEPGYQNTSTYTLAGRSFPKNDQFRRQLFTTVVQLRN